MKMAKILIVDDDPKLLKMLQRTLEYENMKVSIAANGMEALTIVDQETPDLIILDWMMPKMDGITFLGHLREVRNQVVVLMLTARDAIDNRVEGLESGADDYLVKPFAPAELVARVHALLRRIEPKKDDVTMNYANIALNPSTRDVTRGDQQIQLTVTEFNLLRYFMQHPRQVLERSQILNEIWGYDFGGDDNVLEIYVGYLRKKLESLGEARVIQTVRGVGYVLREE
jgi:two-component system response regulator MprA